MKSTVKIAKTVEMAVLAAIEELNCSREEAIVEILEKPKSGLFGLIGSRDAVVKVSCEENIEELLNEVVETSKTEKTEKKEEILEDIIIEKEEIVEKTIKKDEVDVVEKKQVVFDEETKLKTKNFLVDVIKKMGIEANIETFHEDNFIKFNIIPKEENDIGIIIGKRGETLDAIQYIVNLVANRNSSEYLRISIDSNGYREKRIKSLESLARKMAGKAKKYNRNMKLEPMNPYERRIIHSALQGMQGISTVSEGDEPYRRVVIRVKRKNK